MSSYIQIGAGFVFFNPTAGNLPVNPTPVRALTVQDVEIDISGTVEELKGQYQFPEDTAVTDKKGSGKMTIGRKDLSMLNNIFFADISAAGGTSVSPVEAHPIPASTPYTITVTPPGTGTFYADLGVYYANNVGQSFTRIPTGTPTAGQYTVSAGEYTFAAADTGIGVLISYAYTQSTTGSIFQVNNQNIGWGPQVEIYVVDTYEPVAVSGVNIYSTVRIWAAKITKCTLGNKRANYSMPEIDYSYFSASNNRVLDLYSNVK